MKKSPSFRLTFLSPAKRKPAEPQGDSVFKLGVAIPLVSRFFINARISGREKAIRKLGEKVSRLVQKEQQRVDRVIDIAKRSDIKTVFDRAVALQDKLEQAACAKPSFTEDADDDSPSTPGRPKVKKSEPLNIRCIHAMARELFGKDQTTGMVSGKGNDQKFKRDELNVYLDKCVNGGGQVKISAAVVDALTNGTKKGDVSIQAEEE